MKRSNKNIIITAQMDGKEQAIDVPPNGSLGLLALGYRGIIAWREARNKAIAEGNSEISDDKRKDK